MSVLLSLLLSINAAAGSHADVFARDLEEVHSLLMLDDGTLLASRPALNDVIAMRDRNSDGHADEIRTAVSSIEGASALAMRDNTLYIAGADAIFAADRQSDGSFGDVREIVSDVHDSAAIGAGPDGSLYVATPSMMLQFGDDGGMRRIYSRGTQKIAAFDWDPQTRMMWGADESGTVSRIGDGIREPVPLRLTKPAAFVFTKDEAFSVSGDRIVRVRFLDGKPQAAEDVITGVHATGLAAARDGTLFFSDQQTIYRVSSTPSPMASNAAPEPVRTILSKAFHVDGLQAPTAVVHDEEQDVYFVAGGGAVARVTPSGTVDNAKFIDDLRSPTALTLLGSRLWVADGSSVRVFDRVSGAPVRTIDLAPRGAVALTGIAAGGDDAIYVTDSDVRIKESKERVRAGDGRIFRIAGDIVEVALAGEDLHSPNAIAWDGLRFLIAQGYGNEIVEWNPGGGTKAVMRGPGAYAGMVVLPNGAIIVSSEYDEALHVGFGGGELRPLFTRKPTPGGIGFDRKRNRLLIPSRDGDWLEAWTLPPMESHQRPADRSLDGRISRQVVHQPVRIVSTNWSGSFSARISSASR